MWDSNKWSNMSVIGIPNGKKQRKSSRRIFEKIMADIFLKINERHQPIDLRSSGNPKKHE